MPCPTIGFGFFQYGCNSLQFWQNTRNIIRWVFFIPAAFVASIFAGAAGTYIAKHLYSWQWLIWVVSGCFSAVVFILVGVRVAPRMTGIVKWSLIGLLLGLGSSSAIGSLIGHEPVEAIAGIAMTVIALACARLSIPQFESMKNACV
jgi:hypothetical protein